MVLNQSWQFWELVFGVAAAISVLHFFAAAVMMTIRNGRRMDSRQGLMKVFIIVAVLPMAALLIVRLLLATLPHTEEVLFWGAMVGAFACLPLLLGIILFVADCYELIQLERRHEADIERETARFRVRQDA